MTQNQPHGWRKASRSANGQDCVEVKGFHGTVVGVRDSKNPTGPALMLSGEAWRTLASRLKTATS